MCGCCVSKRSKKDVVNPVIIINGTKYKQTTLWINVQKFLDTDAIISGNTIYVDVALPNVFLKPRSECTELKTE